MAEESLESFLEKIGLKDTIDTFKKEDVSLDLLMTMTADDLKETGLSLGKRKMILNAIANKGCTSEVQPFYPPPVQLKPDVRVKERVMGNYRNCNGDWKKEEVRIVLIGKTGSGKSATGNTILGGEMFQSYVSVSSVTSECLKKQAVRFNKKIVIVDTPGIFDTEQTNEKIQHEIAKCIGITSPGPHAFIMVLSIARYTREEHESIMHFVKYFGDEAFKHFIVLFTRKDELDRHEKTIQDHLKTAPPHLLKFVEKSGRRVIAFNNNLSGEESDAQVVDLLSMILENIESNRGECYTNEMYLKAEKLIKEMEEAALKMARAEREKEIEEIESKLAQRYEGKFAEEREKARKKMMHEVDKRYRIAEEKARDNVRDEIEQNKGFFTKLAEALFSTLAKLNPFNLG